MSILTPPCVLSIAGTDPSGGAGIQADLKTFHQFKVYGMAVVSLLTIQNTKGLSSACCQLTKTMREQFVRI